MARKKTLTHLGKSGEARGVTLALTPDREPQEPVGNQPALREFEAESQAAGAHAEFLRGGQGMNAEVAR